jgi:hypothetical protein
MSNVMKAHTVLMFRCAAAIGYSRSKFPFLMGICLLFAGCIETDRSSLYIPSIGVAESAVKSAMDAWKRGEPVGVIEGTTPPIQVVDSSRKPGQKLEDYEILGEVPGNAPRCFAVKIRLSSPDKEEKLRYIVVGLNPLWVFRQEDYDLLAHWEHPMEEKPAKK